jgi:zinc and cadmium transporter
MEEYMSTWAFALLSTTLVSAVSLVGLVALAMRKDTLDRITFLLVSLAVGAMFGDAFIHLLPEAYEHSGSHTQVSLLVLAGIFGFFVMEKFLHWHHCHAEQGGEHGHIHPMGYMSLFADGFENLIDGILIGSSYLVSTELGLAVTIAVVLHEIPNELGKFGILLQAGFSRGKALFFNVASAATAIVGTLLALWLGSSVSELPHIVTPIAAGAFIYLAGTDLIPQLHKETRPSKSGLQLLGMLAGVGIMLLIASFGGHAH